jgi:glucose/mannose transport system substrate-binding protein
MHLMHLRLPAVVPILALGTDPMRLRTLLFSVCFASAAAVPAAPVVVPVPEQSAVSDNGLILYHWWTSVSETAAVNALVEVFRKQYPDVAVSPRATGAHGGGSRMFLLVSRAAAAGRPPHAFQTHAGAQVRPYFDAGLLIPIDQVWASSGLEKVVPAMVRSMSSIDGHYYSLPMNVHRNNLVWYNRTLLDRHGIDPNSLTTWEALFKAADKLKAAGVRSPVQIGEAWTLGVVFESVMASLGIGSYEDWINGRITTGDDARLLEAFGILKRYLAYANPDHAGTAWDVAIKRLIRSESAFCIMGDWANGEFQLARMKYNKDYGALPVPGTKGMYGVTVDAFAQTRGATNPTNSNRFMSVAASREGQDAFNAAKGSISARTDADVARYDPYQRSAIADFKAARYIYPNLTSATDDAFKNGVDDIMKRFAADLDTKKAATAMAAAATRSQGRLRQHWSLQ